jgi:hypothetical protein
MAVIDMHEYNDTLRSRSGPGWSQSLRDILSEGILLSKGVVGEEKKRGVKFEKKLKRGFESRGERGEDGSWDRLEFLA